MGKNRAKLLLTDDDVMKLLRTAIAIAGSQRAWATVSDVDRPAIGSAECRSIVATSTCFSNLGQVWSVWNYMARPFACPPKGRSTTTGSCFLLSNRGSRRMFPISHTSYLGRMGEGGRNKISVNLRSLSGVRDRPAIVARASAGLQPAVF
jgi:hypothetical protein